MNIDKAREHFSAYYEGSMDRGLRQTFERRLSEDAQIAAEYRAFEKMMGELEVLTDIPVSIPQDLHERISARVDKHVWEGKQAKPAASWFNWMRIGLVGVGVAAVAGLALMQSGNFSATDKTVGAGITSGPRQSAPSLNIAATEKGVSVSLTSSSSHKLVIRSDDVLETVDLGGNGPKSREIQNEGSSARVVSLELEGQKTVWVAIPGAKRTDSTLVEGSLKDMAKAIAGRFLVPVVLEVPNADQATRWSASADSPMTAVEPATRESGLKAEVKVANQSVLVVSQD